MLNQLFWKRDPTGLFTIVASFTLALHDDNSMLALINTVFPIFRLSTRT